MEGYTHLKHPVDPQVLASHGLAELDLLNISIQLKWIPLWNLAMQNLLGLISLLQMLVSKEKV